MLEWSSKQYLKFENQRTQPAIDLAMHIANYRFKDIVDIGCGPGNSTNVLRQIFPNANIIGIDNSRSMIKAAQSNYPEINFLLCDAKNLEGKYDLIFSNACFQWIPNHEELISGLMEKLNENGMLAVQIPINQDEPLFQIINEVKNNPKWKFDSVNLEHNETLKPQEYYNLLAKYTSRFDIWETKYYHSLKDHRALVEWVKGTRLRPYLAYLNDEEKIIFENEIIDKAKKAYPIMDNGEVILCFKRLFFIAVK